MSAEAAIVVDRATGKVLGAKNPDEWRAPASVTKIMTALIASEAITAGEVSLSDTVTIPADVSFEIWDTDVALLPGDRISLRDLLYMTLVNSEGDAATSVAMHVGGYPSLSGLDAREAFIEQMNDRADELGLHDTNFVNVSGADPEDLGPNDEASTTTTKTSPAMRNAPTATTSTSLRARITRPPATWRRSRTSCSTTRCSPRS